MIKQIKEGKSMKMNKYKPQYRRTKAADVPE